MAFDVFVTISGLCLLVRRKEELLVLLPPTFEHHVHVPVLGSEVRYQPDRADEAVNGFVEHRLAEQTILLDVDSEHEIDTQLHDFDIAELPKGAGTLRPDLGYVRFVLSDGAPAPRGLCTQEKGEKWLYQNRHDFLATELHWRIRDVTSDAGGSEGLSIRVSTTDKGAYDVVLRPVNRQVRLYLFHTLPDELPSTNPPSPKQLLPGAPAPHFCHYYDLFTNAGECEPPIFKPDDVDSVRRRTKVAFLQGHAGRRYSCVVASFDDTDGS